MIIKTLAELRQADDRTLPFSPLGLGGRMLPEDSAEFQQRVVVRHELAVNVAEGTRQSFEQLREIYAYGVLCYPIYTMVNDHALLVFEQALRDRFVDFHTGSATFIHRKSGETQSVTAEQYEQVRDFVRRNGKYQLRVGDGPETMPFNGMLSDLLTWARKVELLRGQRNRFIEQAIARLRNYVAHPSAYHLTTPVNAASTISDLAEIINHLWGSPTPGGRLYPAPVERDIVAVMWDDTTSTVMSAPVATETAATRGETSPGGPDPDGWTWVLVRGVANDWDLLQFDARYETSRYPAEWLWGPGSAQDAFAWASREHPTGDTVDALDRDLLLRYHGGLLYLPQDPQIAAAAATAEQAGTWFVLRADAPDVAFNHQRQVLAGGYNCRDEGECPFCPVETIGGGSWQEAVNLLVARGVTPQPRHVPDVRVPSRMRWPRSNRILDGSWDIPEQER